MRLGPGGGMLKRMARMARIVIPGLPHHVTQRGNRRQDVFFEDFDYAAYQEFVRACCDRAGVQVWAYYLMPNHVHLILVPKTVDGLHRALREAHRRYTVRINERNDWRGYLWQGRFASFPMDERHLFAAARYVELNPVRAGLVRRPEEWLWSSARSHLGHESGDPLVDPAPLLELVPDWRDFLTAGLTVKELDDLRLHERTGRPLGAESFIAGLEVQTGRMFKKRPPGPKPAHDGN